MLKSMQLMSKRTNCRLTTNINIIFAEPNVFPSASLIIVICIDKAEEQKRGPPAKPRCISIATARFVNRILDKFLPKERRQRRIAAPERARDRSRTIPA